MNKDKAIVYMICDDKQIKMTRDVFDYLMTVKHYNKKLKEEIIKLQQENEKLKEQNNDLRKIYRNTYIRLFENGNDELAHYFSAQIDDCPTFYVEPIIDYVKEYKIYKSRCEKAIELYKNCKEEDYCILSLNMYEALNGSDEN